MGIFSGDRAQHDQPGGSTIVAADTKLDGNLTLSDNLHIDGQVVGEIESKADVALGEQGRFNGNIRARNIYVSGKLEGRVSAERLEIVAGGSVEGEIETADLVIEPGGRFNGSSTIRTESSATISNKRGDREKPAATNHPLADSGA
ncbi:MAG: polymer-forming cytoskeletal protein [Pseudomonadota bacterium]